MDMIYFWVSVIWLLGLNLLAELSAIQLSGHLYDNDYEMWEKLGKPWTRQKQVNLFRSKRALRKLMWRVLFKGGDWIVNKEDAKGLITRVRFFYAGVWLGGINMIVCLVLL